MPRALFGKQLQQFCNVHVDALSILFNKDGLITNLYNRIKL